MWVTTAQPNYFHPAMLNISTIMPCDYIVCGPTYITNTLHFPNPFPALWHAMAEIGQGTVSIAIACMCAHNNPQIVH